MYGLYWTLGSLGGESTGVNACPIYMSLGKHKPATKSIITV